jgi:hypothetical protein
MRKPDAGGPVEGRKWNRQAGNMVKGAKDVPDGSRGEPTGLRAREGAKGMAQYWGSQGVSLALMGSDHRSCGNAQAREGNQSHPGRYDDADSECQAK